ncbi:MAG TPA: M12 family metallopeptidase [Bacteroidales bacterium]|nr:M12 family metallopeptidase [Bacteroidales bacterium]
MFKFLNKSLLLVFVFSSVVTSGQFIRVNNDSISYGNDSIVILTIPHYRGNLFWQQSLDKENWITSNLNNKDSISVSLEFGSYYRACVREGTCDPIISDTVTITIPDSVNVLYDDSLLEMAYPDSLGRISRFFNDEDTLSCLIINNEFVYQGDIILTSDQINRFLKLKGAGIGHSQHINLWPNNTVYYSTSGSCLNPQYWFLCVYLPTAINHWENNTPIRFEKRTDELNYIDFVFTTDSKSSSKLGMIGGRQEIKLGAGSTVGTIIHEIGHALGLVHETNRPDWDKWIKIDFNNLSFASKKS